MSEYKWFLLTFMVITVAAIIADAIHSNANAQANLKVLELQIEMYKSMHR